MHPQQAHSKVTQKGIAILGSTGSIGTSSLQVIAGNPERFKVTALAAHSNVQLLAEQIREFRPSLVAIKEGLKDELLQALEGFTPLPEVLEGKEGQLAVATHKEASQVIAAVVGAAGIEPVVAAIRAKKDIALANKEAIVLAGKLVMEEVEKHKVMLLPVDSEHNAIFQSLKGDVKEGVSFITLTASGGPFRATKKEDFAKITKAEALNHPNWDMGAKITIDSASMMNKALEIIEARWLFDLQPEDIKVVVHKESIIHSMVTYKDNSFVAQLGVPDMRIPIAYCLGYPERVTSTAGCLDLATIGKLHFEAPDFERFPTLQFAYDTLKLGGGATACLNGANEALVALLLEDKIQFAEIFSNLKKLVAQLQKIWEEQTEHPPFLFEITTIQDAIDADQWGRDFITSQYKNV